METANNRDDVLSAACIFIKPFIERKLRYCQRFSRIETWL